MRTLTTYDDEGQEVEVPASWAICTSCDGEGGSSAHLGVFFPDDEYMRDDDFREDYFAGRFDRPCNACKGSGKVLEIDRLRASDEQQRWYDETEAERAEADAIQAAEIRAGC